MQERHETHAVATQDSSSEAHGSHGMRGSDRTGDGGHAAMHMEPRATRPQLRAMTALTLLMLAGGVLIAALFGDFGMGEEERGLIMPPGMVMSSNNSNPEAMRDMAAVDPDDVDFQAPEAARGDQTLEWRREGKTKVFALTASVIEWNILPDRMVRAYAFNRMVPGPRIHVTQGDRVRLNVRNELPEATSVHWHGLVLPNGMDGAAEVTQRPIEPGGRFTYEFRANQPGTFFYHSHKDPDRQQALGLYGALIVDPREPDSKQPYDQDVTVQLQEWAVKQDHTFPAMEMEGSLPNFFTINGKAYPETDAVRARVGERIRFRFVGSNTVAIHPMHIHGGPFRLVETDGNRVPHAAQIQKDTVNVAPGERYDIVWTARREGRWLLHCHIPHHTTNDNIEEDGGGGLTMLIDVRA
jgi:FtsP/CotA-like multicopper oxidase with cupredoxin domain